MAGTYDLKHIEILLKERKAGGEFVYDKLCPNTFTDVKAGRIVYQEDIETLPTEADFIHQDGSSVSASVINLETPITYATRRWIDAEVIPHTRKNARTDDVVTVAGALSRRMRKFDLLLENLTKTEFDTNVEADTNTATSTRARVTSAKWTAANASTQILPDIVGAWEAFMTQCGREPNFIWMHPSVAQIVSNAFLFYQPESDFKPTIEKATSQQFYNKLFGAVSQPASVMYKSATATYSHIWDKQFYMGYVSNMPNYETATRAYGATMTWKDNGSEFWTNQIETEDGSTKVLASTYKGIVTLDANCGYKIAGPKVAGPPDTYDLV